MTTKKASKIQIETEPGKKRKSRTGMIQLGVWVNEDIYQEFKILAVYKRCNAGALIEKAMQEYLDRQGKTHKEAD